MGGITNRRNVEPTNCRKVNSVQANDPKKAVEDYITINPASNCCTIDPSGKVTQWQLPDNARVQLTAKSGTTFYYDSTKLPLD